ncbi:hypothetical protein H181DRAFT_05521 [Streptomyces sp. WMMB 714]|jgi:hypothetical protein|uniref:Uncharacterized protein n=1 Tax=Streptomyces daqingensis TaxID=1472640 RepID=A0ABQ2MKZ2_9ACTN|nr:MULTISPECIES: hypothetical protein [Streptomyces]GGO53771.1 hypothetical protein GCM10012287_41210 [Streptomyces daqingensis]SCK58187.1 hypothetical protein H181DRAFT_05521 [Streptomyces sp. WMMB 714]
MAAHTVHASHATTEGTVLQTTLRALESFESLLLGRGRETALRNAWTAVLEDRRRAAERTEAQRVLEAAATSRPAAT